MVACAKKEVRLIDLNDPLYLKTFIDKYVEVTTVDGTKTLGKVYTIDPVSECVLLLSHHVDQEHVVLDIIIGNAIKEIELTLPEENINIPNTIFDNKLKSTFTQEEIVARRKIIENWLATNRICVKEDGAVLRLNNSVEIGPPYEVNSCSSLDGNEIILGRIQDLVAATPCFLLGPGTS